MNIQSINASVQILESNSIKQFPHEGIGDVLKAQVVGKSDSEVVLRLENGNVITASTEIPLDVQVGDTIQLQIKDKQDGKIMLETLKSNNGEIIKNSNTDQIRILINSMGITPNDNNISVVNEMMNKQMPLTRDNVQAVLKGITKFAELDIPKAVFMLANNIPFEEKNIKMLSQYQEGKIKLGNQIKTLVDLVDQIEDPKLLEEALQKLNKIDEGNKSKAIDSLVEKVIKSSVNTSENNFKNDNKQVIVPQIKIDENTQKTDKRNTEPFIIKQEQISLIKKVITDKIDFLIKDLASNIQDNADVQINDIKKAVMNMSDDQVNEVLKQMPKNEKETIIRMLETIVKKDDIFSIDKKEFINTKDIETLKKEINSHFQKHFINPLSDSLKDDLYITENYKELMGKLESIKDSISARTGTSEIQTLIGHTEENINFMRDISQYNAFVQIPLNIWGEETNGQLFVLKKDKRKIDPANASIFLSLDMPNIGLTEVFVRVQGKNVDCNFRMESENLVCFLKNNANKLVQALNSNGYKFISVNCSKIDKKTGIIEVEKNFENDNKGKKFSIDVKV